MGAPRNTYKAFLSYSHEVDSTLAHDLQRALEAYARPWLRPRAFRVFRDQACLSLNDALWPALEKRLLDSEYFVLMCCPAAARSRWVEQEANTWLEHRSKANLLLILTEGEFVWDPGPPHTDSEASNPLPPRLRDAFSHEPFWLDLRWTRDSTSRDLRDPRFRDAVATIAARLHGRSKDELEGDAARRRQRTRRALGFIAALFLLLATVASVFAWVAWDRSQVAERERRLAESTARDARQRAKEASDRLAHNWFESAVHAHEAGDPLLAAHRFARAAEIGDDSVGAAGSFGANWLTGTSRLVADLSLSERLDLDRNEEILGVAQSADERHLLVWDSLGRLFVRDARTGTPILGPLSHSEAIRGAAWLSGGERLLSWGDDGFVRFWSARDGAEAEAIDVRAASNPEHESVHAVIGPADDRLAVYSLWGRLAILELPTGRVLSDTGALAGEILEGVAFSADGNRVVLWSNSGESRSRGSVLRIYDARSGAPLSFEARVESGAEQAAISRDGRHVASVHRDKHLRVWDVESGALLSDARVASGGVAFSPVADELLAWGPDAAIWSLERDDAPRASLETEGNFAVSGAKWSADGGRIFLWGSVRGPLSRSVVRRHDRETRGTPDPPGRERAPRRGRRAATRIPDRRGA